ncbi:MAG: aminoacyl-tRNA hydrolase [Anaerolineae bacterium]|nr:aminoacyl-tRNA hydrolase [Anaerolineae bacterium]
MYLIAGLGNPGARYENTRHNIGFRAVERFAAKHGLTFGKIEHKAQTASGTAIGQRVLLAKPQTFMNVSGESVQPLASFYKVPPERLIVVADDLDLPLGTVRLRKSGSSGGQNGLKSILQRLGTQEIARVRLGIGRPPGRMDPTDYVLGAWKGDEAIIAVEMQDRAVAAIETWLRDGIELAMSRFNGVVESAKPPASPPPQPPVAP